MANLRGWSDLAFGMSSGASAVYGWIRLAELVSTNKFSRPHLLRRAGIFKKTLKNSILDKFGAATPQNYIYIYISPHSYPRIGGSMSMKCSVIQH